MARDPYVAREFDWNEPGVPFAHRAPRCDARPIVLPSFRFDKNVTRENMASKYHLAQEALMQYQAEQSAVRRTHPIPSRHHYVSLVSNLQSLTPAQAKERERLRRFRALERTSALVTKLQSTPTSLGDLSSADAVRWEEQLQALEPSVSRVCTPACHESMSKLTRARHHSCHSSGRRPANSTMYICEQSTRRFPSS